MSKSPEILFEDEHLIAVNKTADLLSIPDTFYAERSNAKTEVKEVLEKVDFIKHIGKDNYKDSKKIIDSIILSL